MKFIAPILKLANNDVTVACSAGSDSIAVAHFLKTKYPKINLKCFHYNHKLREQNNVMEENVRWFCRNENIPLTISRRCLEVDSGTSEADLRSLRYAAMHNLGNVITGHHLDDYIESYLFNCFNGVPEYLPIPLRTIYKENLTILRPFAITRKTEVRHYIEKNNLSMYVVEDETNEDDEIRRNWLRNILIPQINSKGYNLETIVKKKLYDHVFKNF